MDMNKPSGPALQAGNHPLAAETLHRHSLSHIPELKVNPSLFKKRFAQGCSMLQCNADCCSGGVFADVKERDNILAHVELIQQHMEPGQEKNPDKWFENFEVDDIDFPSLKAVGTQITDQGCVFLKANGQCALQVAGAESGKGKFSLKPYFCFAYPVLIDHHELKFHDNYAGREECCNSVPSGELNIFDVCAEEFEFMLGKEGLEELKSLAEPYL
jgi:hypothetical protein